MELLFDEQGWVKWLWQEKDLEIIKQGIKLGYDVHKLAEILDEDPDNVGLAMIHVATKGLAYEVRD